ncbi:anaerobic ribonucleoside-triphosphate reductase activating protein [Xanthomonadaceae bacterium JHOS43]|nr:anaerobic ribonucleoside-triphosphate reductase activating protein [Xanthomonadaceae bacterium JHOS43]
MIRVGGMTPLTSIDFPGRLAAVLFLQGCPWRCGYCHNPELLPARADTGLAWEQVEAFLQRRRGLLDGVVFSGGEPTSQATLADALVRVRELGYQTGLHTGGMYPQRLHALLPQLDWIGLDIKAPDADYDRITGRRGSAGPVRLSLETILHSGVDFECRTTWRPELFSVDALYRLGADLRSRGVRHWAVQECRIEGRVLLPMQRPDPARLGEGFVQFAYRAG